MRHGSGIMPPGAGAVSNAAGDEKVTDPERKSAISNGRGLDFFFRICLRARPSSHKTAVAEI